ncbi:hypothetical protein ABIB14_001152 [Arthrobacter sp. UYEF3]
MYHTGAPDDIAERIVERHAHMGHVRHFLQVDIGRLP